ATVEELVHRLAAACPGARLIFVDNASTDRTAEILSRMPDVTLVRHERNLGYGRSLATGLETATAEQIVMIDGDLEYLPEDVPRLATALGPAAAVYGSRFLGRAGNAPDGTALWSWGNRLVTHAFNLSFGQQLTDLYTGIRAVRRAALPRHAFTLSGFEFV